MGRDFVSRLSLCWLNQRHSAAAHSRAMERRRALTEDYCTVEEVERETENKGGVAGGEGFELHLSFTLSGDCGRPVDERGAWSAQRKRSGGAKKQKRKKTTKKKKTRFWELTPPHPRSSSTKGPFISNPLLLSHPRPPTPMSHPALNEVDLLGPNQTERIIFQTTK